MSDSADTSEDSSSLVDLPADLRAELAEAFGATEWEDVPIVVRNNFRTPNADLEGYLEEYGDR